MVYVALILSICSFILSVAVLISFIASRREMRRPHIVSPWSDELLTRDAWLEEIEARGEAVLARIEAAEKRLHVPPAQNANQVQAPAVNVSDAPQAASAPGTVGASPAEKRSTDSTATVGDVVEFRAEKSLSSKKSPRPPEASRRAASGRRQHADVRAQVRLLADQGLDVTTIAQRLQLGRGEVELLLGLSNGGHETK